MASEHQQHELVGYARELQPQIRAQAARIEADGLAPRDLIDDMTARGLFRLTIPKASYGEQAHPLVVFHVIEALAEADASVAWVAMIASEVSLLTAWLPNAVLSQMIGGDEPGGPSCRIVGSSRVMAEAEPDLCGYRLTGQLNFVSGVDHATFILVTFHDASGDPRMALLPQRAGQIVRTWDTMGLRATGSHDWRISDAYVQSAHTWSPLDPPRVDAPQWRIPDRSIVAWIANAGHALGTAQGALDELSEASSQATTGDASPLGQREPFRLAFARAQAMVSASRAHVRAAWDEAWRQAARPDGQTEPAARAAFAAARLANVHAVHQAADAVETLFRASGTNAVHRRWTLERRFRDLQVARQHGAALEWNYDAAVRPALGLDDRRAR